MINIFASQLFSYTFRSSTVHTISIGRALVDYQHEKQMGDFLQSNVLEQYLSNVLWPD